MAFSGLTGLTKYPEHFGIALFVDFCSSSRKWWSWLWLGENYTECLGYIAIAKHFSIMIIVIIIVSMITTTTIPIIVICNRYHGHHHYHSKHTHHTTITFTIISDRFLLLWLHGAPEALAIHERPRGSSTLSVIQASYFFWPLLQTCKWLGCRLTCLLFEGCLGCWDRGPEIEKLLVFLWLWKSLPGKRPSGLLQV